MKTTITTTNGKVIVTVLKSGLIKLQQNGQTLSVQPKELAQIVKATKVPKVIVEAVDKTAPKTKTKQLIETAKNEGEKIATAVLRKKIKVA